jgi:hypothetical protein
VKRDVRAFQHQEQFVFLCAKPRQQPVESGKACFCRKEGFEAALKFTGAARRWRLAVSLESIIEAPDTGADALLCLDVRFAERIELMDETLRMNPAER